MISLPLDFLNYLRSENERYLNTPQFLLYSTLSQPLTTPHITPHLIILSPINSSFAQTHYLCSFFTF